MPTRGKLRFHHLVLRQLPLWRGPKSEYFPTGRIYVLDEFCQSEVLASHGRLLSNIAKFSPASSLTNRTLPSHVGGRFVSPMTLFHGLTGGK